jgi:hypothetical protein
MLVPVGPEAPEKPPWDDDADEPTDVPGVIRIDFASNDRAPVEVNDVRLVGNQAKRDERTFALLVALAMRRSNSSAGTLGLLDASLLENLPGWRSRGTRATLQSALGQLVLGGSIVKQYGDKGPGKSAYYYLAVPAFLFEPPRLKAWLYPEGSVRRGPDGPLLSGNLASWVTRGTQQVAIVGQNLATSLRRQDVRDAIARLLQENSSSVADFTLRLVVQTPQALAATYPVAAAHLFRNTSQYFEELTAQLGPAAASQVVVIFHPGATLSMLVLDWNVEGRSPIVYFTPKLQVANESARRNYRATGKDYDAIVGEFSVFLEEAASTSRRADAGSFPLPEAAGRLAGELAWLKEHAQWLYDRVKVHL